jgi:hypothetical protein
MQPCVSIVIVTWNRSDCVLNMLDSLRTISYRNVHVIIVDNASTDDSLTVIRQHPLQVILLENRENLGGSGGFNAGIKYALKELDQDYIWLLDNDAEVTADTLESMVRVMERDLSIGIVGSCVLSPEDHDLIVEAGGRIDINKGVWIPHRRYERYEQSSGKGLVEDVDYVPACSALIRTEVFQRIGLLDERFFLHWDDIDFCVRMRRSGMRVVTALDAKVYHGAEKGYSPVTLYYDFRNALLFFSKHFTGVGFIRVAIAILKKYMSSYGYLWLLGKRRSASYLLSGLKHFMSGRYGRASVTPADMWQDSSRSELICTERPMEFRKVIVFAVGSFETVVATVAAIRATSPGCRIVVAAASDRIAAYRIPGVDDLLGYNLSCDGMAGKLATAAKFLFGGYDAGVSAGTDFMVPYSFLFRRNFEYHVAKNSFSRIGVSRRVLWKIPASMLAGWLMLAWYILPVLVVARSNYCARKSQ